MPQQTDRLASRLSALEKELARLRPDLLSGGAIDKWRTDTQALLFHLRNKLAHAPLLVIFGGTGTGKSTLVNRLLDANVSAASFRRTYTSGAIAIAKDPAAIPDEWLRLPRQLADESTLPARGQAGTLVVVQLDRPATEAITLIDTPDLDGDQPAHHAEADRVFRWAEALIFLVTPEKYQMTELLPYYRLAKRYAIPALFVMNKCEEPAVLEDFRKQLAFREWADAKVFAIPRDDAAYEPPQDSNLPALRAALPTIPKMLRDPSQWEVRRQAINHRTADLLGRLQDQVLAPLRQQRREADRLIAGLRAMATPPVGVDVSPLTTQLQRRMQEQSVLYLIGPQRILDRVRQMPGLLARLPRSAWDLLMKGQTPGLASPKKAGGEQNVPDFPKLLSDQLTIIQSRIDDLLMTSPAAQQWLDHSGDSYRQSKLNVAEAGKIADEELAGLKLWLEQRWHGTPRDTRILQRLIALLPGGKTLTQWSEAAPYLLAIVLAAHGALFGHVDLLILGSYSLATWLGEKLSNEVTSRTRQANRQIAARFAQLAQTQLNRVCDWLDQQAVKEPELHRLERMADELAEEKP